VAVPAYGPEDVGLEREPHVRLMVVGGAIMAAVAVAGTFVACNAPAPPPVRIDFERGPRQP
jgi:hypothetical protein